MEYKQCDAMLQSLAPRKSTLKDSRSKGIMATLWWSQSWPNELSLTKTLVLELPSRICNYVRCVASGDHCEP